MIEIEPITMKTAITVFFVSLGSLFLYAEIHYKPRFLRGLLYRKQPEIIFDTPQRIETDRLPVALIIKDAHKFKIELNNILIQLFINDKPVDEFSFQENLTVDSKFFSRIYNLNIKKYKGTQLEIKCYLECKTVEKQGIVLNNNYPFLKDKKLVVYPDTHKRPTLEKWQWGDIHCHSHYTEDQVEFGFPLQHFPEIGLATGLSFAAITDHSYDLDDKPESWTGKDPQLTKWHNMRKQITQLNRRYPDFTLLPGEEVSVDNGSGKTVHMLVINSDQYFPGSGDSFENGFFQTSELSFKQILDELDNKKIALAAHPFEKPSLVQSIFLKRGTWNIEIFDNRLDGYQILNGKQRNGFTGGKKEWIKTLLQGKRSLIYAGNDSHGFLNRFISIHAPLLSINNSEGHIFGEMVTAVKNTDIDVAEITKGLKNDPVIISSGPLIDLFLINGAQEAGIGETLNSIPQSLKIKAKSIPYFGKIKEIHNYISDCSSNREVLINTYNLENLTCEKEIQLSNIPKEGYIRSELTTTRGNFALTNPVWYKAD